MIHILAETNGAWQHTWTHFSVSDAVNTALSADHIAAECFAELVTGLFSFAIGRNLLARHDRRHHSKKLGDFYDQDLTD